MRIFSKLYLGFAALAVVAGVAVSCEDDNDDTKGDNGKKETEVDATVKYFATTDMTWAEFYAGEIGKSESVLTSEGCDAVTSATRTKSAMFSASVVKDSSIIIGVRDVNVGMTESVYKSLTADQKLRYKFVEGVTPIEYKQLNADGSFGKMNSKVVSQKPSAVSLSCGVDAKHDQYLIKMEGVDLAFLRDSVTRQMSGLLGAVLTTTDGTKYGMRPLYNLWLNAAEFGFSVSQFTNVHGCEVGYKYTSSLEGKTIKNITYMAKDMDDVSIDMNVYVKKSTNATVSANELKAGSDPKVTLTFAGVPSDANYKLATVKSGSGRSAVTLTEDKYTYADGVLTIKEDVVADATYSVSFVDDKYVNIGVSLKAK